MKNENYSLTRSSFDSINSFTVKYNEIVKEIIIDCALSPVEKLGFFNAGREFPVRAVWDTGCAGCLITRDFANKIGLKSHRKAKHYYKESYFEKNCYMAYIHLPNGIGVPVELAEVKWSSTPIIIGMDIICKGNFFIENTTLNTLVRFDMSQNERINVSKPGMDFKIEVPDLITEEPKENSILLEYGQIVRSLRYQCKISTPEPNTETLTVLSAWDTGATRSMISKSLAAKLNVRTVGKLMMMSVNSPQKVDTCFVTVHLFDGSAITVLAGIQDEDERQDLLIGMDIISIGNFSIESIGNETSLLFKLPI
jgi:hypothetical protein